MTSLFKSKDKGKVAATPDKKDNKDKKTPNNNNNDTQHDPDSLSQSQSPGRYMKNLKEYAIIMEYKKLKQLAPEGVYVMPSTDSIRRWHGVIFLRHSLYRKGVFKFVIDIPESYPNDAPKVFFTSKVFNPLVNIKTGELDLSIQFPVWNPNQHYIVLVLGYLKKIFFKTEFWGERLNHPAFNKESQKLWMQNKDEFIKICNQCACLSVDNVYTNEKDSPIRFTRQDPAHSEIVKRILTPNKERDKDFRYIRWFRDGVDQIKQVDTPLLPLPTANSNNNNPPSTPVK